MAPPWRKHKKTNSRYSHMGNTQPLSCSQAPVQLPEENDSEIRNVQKRDGVTERNWAVTIAHDIAVTSSLRPLIWIMASAVAFFASQARSTLHAFANGKSGPPKTDEMHRSILPQEPVPSYLYDTQRGGENPYFGILGVADAIVATAGRTFHVDVAVRIYKG